MHLLKIIVKLFTDLLALIPTELGVWLRYFFYKPLFKKCHGKFRIDFGVTICGFQNITLGRNINIMKNSYLYAHEGGSLEIGNNFNMNTNSQLGASGGKIVIGNDCSIAPNCVLRASNHTFDKTDIPIGKQGHTYGQIIVEDDVWISSNSVITANTNLKIGTIVAAGSVVTKDTLPYSIVAGVPAKVIKMRKESELY